MKINKKIIEELVNYLKEFSLSEIEYSDGTTIPNHTDSAQWYDLETGVWCYYDNDNQYEATYGKLYNWYAVETGKLCPIGWHVPTDAEWTILTDYLAANGHDGTEGTALKSTEGWRDYNTESGNGTDDYEWLGLPGGMRLNGGDFGEIGGSGFWWSSLEFKYPTGVAWSAWNRSLDYYHDGLFRSNYDKKNGFSVRCLKD